MVIQWFSIKQSFYESAKVEERARFAVVIIPLQSAKADHNFTELGQIESSSFFSFFNLLFVRFNLALESINQGLHPLMIFTVFIFSKGELRNVALRFLQVPLTFSKTPILSFKLRIKFHDTSIQLVNGFFASFESIHISFIQFSLQILDLNICKLTGL